MELALNSVALAAVGCATLVLCGKGYIVPIAQALHRRIREPDRPFVVVDLRRGEQRASVRSPESRGSTVLALGAARRGTCCMRLRRAPADLAEMHRATEDVMLVICGGLHLASDALLIQPAPVVVPLLSSRVHELDRIIIEYAGDAVHRAQHSPPTIARGYGTTRRARSPRSKRPRCGWSRSARRATCPTRQHGLG